MQRDIIVMGAGIAGLQCARELQQAGRNPLVLDRARGVGGRCATRRFEDQPIDFGPMMLHGKDPAFLQALAAVPGMVLDSPWPRHIEGQGAPCQPDTFADLERRATHPRGLNALAKHLAQGLEIQLRTCIRQIRLEPEGFVLETDDAQVFHARNLVLAMALEEILGLLAPLGGREELAAPRALLGMFASVPSLTLMAAYPPTTPEPAWDLHYPEDSEILQLVSQDSRKRERPAYLTLVLQGRPRWSREHLDAPEEAWAPAMLHEAAERIGDWVRHPLWTSPHRWRYARMDRGSELSRPLVVRFKEGARLGLAGDVFSPGGGVQAAWLSGSALAQRLLIEV